MAATMRLAVLSDVHGNLPALDATLAAIRRDAPDAPIWFAGDFVGYGPWPDACVRRIADLASPAIAGNYDEKTLAFPRKAKKWAATKDPRKLAAFRHAFENLSDASRAYLAALPQEHRESVNGHRVLMVHSAPDSEREGIHPLVPRARLDAIAETADADVILTGHTHWPFITRTESGTLFVNVGSCGRPGDGDTRAAWALVTLPDGGPPAAEIRRVAYPVEQVVTALEKTDLSPDFAELYRAGRAGW